jgi:hypothetical protein
MLIESQCPHCQTIHQVEPMYLDVVMTCNSCNNDFEVKAKPKEAPKLKPPIPYKPPMQNLNTNKKTDITLKDSQKFNNYIVTTVNKWNHLTFKILTWVIIVMSSLSILASIISSFSGDDKPMIESMFTLIVGIAISIILGILAYVWLILWFFVICWMLSIHDLLSKNSQ